MKVEIKGGILWIRGQSAAFVDRDDIRDIAIECLRALAPLGMEEQLQILSEAKGGRR